MRHGRELRDLKRRFADDLEDAIRCGDTEKQAQLLKKLEATDKALSYSPRHLLPAVVAMAAFALLALAFVLRASVDDVVLNGRASTLTLRGVPGNFAWAPTGPQKLRIQALSLAAGAPRSTGSPTLTEDRYEVGGELLLSAISALGDPIEVRFSYERSRMLNIRLRGRAVITMFASSKVSFTPPQGRKVIAVDDFVSVAINEATLVVATDSASLAVFTGHDSPVEVHHRVQNPIQRTGFKEGTLRSKLSGRVTQLDETSEPVLRGFSGTIVLGDDGPDPLAELRALLRARSEVGLGDVAAKGDRASIDYQLRGKVRDLRLHGRFSNTRVLWWIAGQSDVAALFGAITLVWSLLWGAVSVVRSP